MCINEVIDDNFHNFLLFVFSSAVPVTAVCAASLVCVPQRSLRRADLKHRLVLLQPEVRYNQPECSPLRKDDLHDLLKTYLDRLLHFNVTKTNVCISA